MATATYLEIVVWLILQGHSKGAREAAAQSLRLKGRKV